MQSSISTPLRHSNHAFTSTPTPLLSHGSTIKTFRQLQFQSLGGRDLRLRRLQSTNDVDIQPVTEQEKYDELETNRTAPGAAAASTTVPSKELEKAVQKTAATFAPRASTASKNPAKPGTALYSVFEVQAYVSMLLGGALSFNLIFPSDEPDLWRLMGMWSIWMFTIPSLRARDCSKKEKEALNYLFILVPMINVVIPFFWKSFAVVWSADTVAFFAMYAWKFGWLQRTE
ncbi:Protein RESISTANCE TO PHYTOPHTHORA 1, chloroplastic [Linum perenne]